MIIGYARVSTRDQNLDMQLAALHGFECEQVYQEKVSEGKGPLKQAITEWKRKRNSRSA